MQDDYDSQALTELVHEALRTDSRAKALFHLGDTRVLETLHDVLKDYLTPADITSVTDDLRDSLYDRRPGSQRDALRALHAKQLSCKLCPNVSSAPVLPHWNLSDPDMVLVTEQPLEYVAKSDLLLNSMKKAGFSSDRVAATAVVRCATDNMSGQHLTNCTKNYLFTELETLAPRLIVSCGSIATSVLANEKVKITEVMGSIFWIGPWPVLPTAAPAFMASSERRVEELDAHLQKAHSFLYG